jgi:fructose-specific phosphotransferase system IIA component
MNILDVLDEHSIKVPLLATEKRAAIEELADLLGETGRIRNVDELKHAVWEREQQRTTGIGEGLAIPHGKSDCSTKLSMAIGKPAEPIDFNSIDKKPVRLIVLLASPPDRTADHIQALGRISRLMGNPDFREQCYDAQTAAELYALIKSAEE